MNTSEVRVEKSQNRIGLIAGSGQFPLLFAQAARQAGVDVIAVGFEGETEPALAKYAARLHILKLGQLNALINTFHEAGVTRAAMAGAINKTRLYTRIRPDWRAVKFLNRLRHKKDDFLLRAFAEELEAEGIHVEPSTIFLPTLLAPEGVLTRRKPNRRERSEIAFGWQTAKAIGYLDIGQCLVVKDQVVLAVEGIDGTDATILRGGRLCREGAVVIKVSKPTQDLRFDVPAVGLDTIETMKRVWAKVLVVEAGKTLMFDRDKMIDAANAAKITIVARKDESAEETDEETSLKIPAAWSGGPAKTPMLDPSASSTALLIRTPVRHASRVAVIGVGYLGRFHAQKYAMIPDANLVAVADINEGQAERIARGVNAKPLSDYRELLGKVDAVSIVTPTPHHYKIARDFLSSGVHVLLEKPMTVTLEEADDLIGIANQNGCVLQVGHLERFNSAFCAVYPHLRNPMFLEALRLAMFNERGLEVNVILDLMIHDIDVALHVVQSPLKAIKASGISVLTSLPDIASVRMEFENGAVANLAASRISIKNMRKLRIFQEDCYFSADLGNKRSYAVRKEKEPDEAGYPQISLEEFEIEETDALEEEIISFLECVKTGRKPLVDGSQGRQALSVALDISRQITEQLRENGIIRKARA